MKLKIASRCLVASSLAATLVLASSETRAPDGVRINYDARGEGATALVFLHGGLANARFWEHQLDAFASDYRVVAIDSAGHGGSSSTERTEWTLATFADDVVAVMDALALERAVLVGNSMGGPIALEVARRLPERVVAIVAVDSLHDAEDTRHRDPERLRALEQALEDDAQGLCLQLARSGLHPDAPSGIREDLERRICGESYSGELLVHTVGAFIELDLAGAIGAVKAPIRGINGDLFPTKLDVNRRHIPGYDAEILDGIGHYPMLEAPERFNDALRRTLDALDR